MPTGELSARCEGGLSQPTLSEKLAGRRERLETELKGVIDAQEQLDKNPDLAEFVNAIAKIGY